MRRLVAGLFLIVFALQPSAPTVADTLSAASHQSVSGRGESLIAVQSGRAPLIPFSSHTPPPRRPLPDYRSHRRFARLLPKHAIVTTAPRPVRPIDLTKLRREVRHEHETTRLPIAKQRLRGRGESGPHHDVLTASATGIRPWWTYQARSLPGIGTAMVNVTNLNFILSENDVSIPAAGLNLQLIRTYNSESEHNANNEDGSTPSVYGNGWTNNYDVHLAWSATGQNEGTVSVYTADGARDDFSCQTNVIQTCTSLTAGVYDLLGSTVLAGGLACQFQLTKKDGTSYIFYAPYAGCNVGAGSYGRLMAIYGRNSTYYVTLAYGWNPNDSNPENLSSITVTHEPDGNQLNLTFGQIAGTNTTELQTVSLPDKDTINYFYNEEGAIVDIDKPGNNPPGVTLPTAFLDGNPIATGNLPETYFVSDSYAGTILEICGPRAAISIINTDQNPTDGACVDFDYVNNNTLSDWWTRGVLNPTPQDDVLSPSAIQSGPSTGFVQWDDTSFFDNNEGSDCNPESEAGMQDAYGHNIVWCYDSSGRVTNTISSVSSSSSLATEQAWDTNNDLISVTDARNEETDIAYDTDGNPVEVALPSQSFTNPQGTYRPTYLLDHDGYNNLTKLCDPVNNASNGWNPSPGPTPCAASGSTHYASFSYSNEGSSNEPYGCLTESYKPSSYWTKYSYGGSCGNGEPTQVTEEPYAQFDSTERNPQQTYTYYTTGYATGLLATYDPGGPHGATWQYSYSTEGMNRTLEVEDPDNVPSFYCYNQDSSVFFSETAYQDYLDGYNLAGPPCPTSKQLENGASAPLKSTSYRYDADRNLVVRVNHHNCPQAGGGCTANNPAPTTCNGVQVLTGATCNFYDGLDRLVEVKLPQDTGYDLYQNPWIMRYLYDLSGGTYSFHGQNYVAYGNLFATQELVPQTAAVTVTATPKPPLLSVANNAYTKIKAYAYDGLDRPVDSYAATGNTSYSTQTFTWDTSPLDPNVAGYLGEVCNSATPTQCQEFDYYTDGEQETFNSNDNSSPERQYEYDADGRPTQITESGFQYPLSYTYNMDGALVSTSDAAQQSNDIGTIAYTLYPDDSREYLSVSAPFSQTNLFSYLYRNDGPLQTYVINDTNIPNTKHAGKTTLTYQYTNAGRLSSRTESGAGVNSSLNLPATQLTYYTYGLLEEEITPSTTLSALAYSAENELTQLTTVPTEGGSSNCQGQYSDYYTVRGELTYGGSPECSSVSQSDFANGVPVSYSTTPSSSAYTWNDLMAIMTSTTNTQSGQGSNWGYDGAGRMNSESEPFPIFTQGPTSIVGTARSYDAENHLTQTKFQSPAPSPEPESDVTWGPDGHPILIGTIPAGGVKFTERLHWNGNQLLFTTHGGSLDDIKVDVQGDILPNDNGYSGLTFYDRGPGTTIMGCHNYNGTNYDGPGGGGGGAGGGGSPCNAVSGMPTSLIWSGTPYGFGPITTLGQGGTLGMNRTDGFTDGFDTIQGVRAYDPTAGQWTSPDADPGSLSDPLSQQAYMWNDNDPMGNEDPTGESSQPNPQPVSTPSSSPPPAICGAYPCATSSGVGCDLACQAPSLGDILNTLGGDLAIVFPCKPACMFATPKGAAKKKCDAAVSALNAAHETMADIVHEFDPNVQDITSKNSNPESRRSMSAQELEGGGNLLTMIYFYSAVARMPNAVSNVNAAEKQVEQSCPVPIY